MSEQSPPEVVAAADLSPLSPSPLHTYTPAVIPSLQDHADSLDVAPLNSPATAARHAHAAMASNPEPMEISDTIVVGGNYSDESQVESVADNDSFDAYGEDEDGQEQKSQPDAGNDDYARTFDSPPQARDELETDVETARQPDVSMASESMNSSPAPDTTLKSQSPAAAVAAAPAAAASASPVSAPAPAPAPAPASHSSPTPELPSPGSSAQNHPSPTENSTEPAAAEPGPTAWPATEPPPPEPVAAAGNSPKSRPAPTVEEPEPAPAGDDNSNVDIQKLVDDITARATAASTSIPPPSRSPPPTSQPLPSSSSLSVSQPPSLPPKPSLAHQSGQPISRPEDFHPCQSQTPNSHAPPASGLPAPPAAAQAIPNSTYMAAGPPGTNGDPISSLPPPPSISFNSSQPFATRAHAQPTSPPGRNPPGDSHPSQAPQTWDTYQADEKRYLTEAKWERFPDGSRIFIGNLSSERVSKREVFDVFAKFGRLAQISLKSAYGFVQFHDVADAQAAMQHAQGAELGGRKIHLEYSRPQKKKDDKDRSPERRNQRGDRGDRGGRATDRYDGRDQGRRGRDGYRPGRSPSPRRGDAYGRDRSHHSSFDRNSRARSRSPQRYSRPNGDQYRHRSPSPHRHGQSSHDLDIPRRYGDQVPDVQLLLLQEVERDFVSWVQRAFFDRGLRSDVMFLNPKFPRDAVVQRQVLEGVHGVIELDLRAQSLGKIPLQVFDRSAGINNVRFDQYQDLDPKIAAELVYRTKTQAVPQPPQHSQPAAYTPSQYGQPYPFPAQPAGYPYQTPHPPPAAAPHSQAPSQDMASVVGQLDNTSLQALLASLQAGQSNPAFSAAPSAIHPQGANPPAVAQNSQIDINALLGSLNAGAALPSGSAPMANYGANPPYHAASHPISPVAGGHPSAVPGERDTAQQVQNIMATLARYRQ